MQAKGNASQCRDGGGWVKALVYLSAGKITRYFNSQSDAPAPVCYHLARGLCSIDFHFQVTDRYITVTPIAANYKTGADLNPSNPFAPFWWPPAADTRGGVPFNAKLFTANIVFDGLTHQPDMTTPPPGQRHTSTTMITVFTFQSLFTVSSGALIFNGFELQDTDVCVAVF
jgi:hypothetical protein